MADLNDVTWVTSIKASADESLIIAESFQKYLEAKGIINLVTELAFVYQDNQVKIWGCSTLYVHNQILLELVRGRRMLESSANNWFVFSQRLTSAKENLTYRALVSHQLLKASLPKPIAEDYSSLIINTKQQQLLFIVESRSWLPRWVRRMIGW